MSWTEAIRDIGVACAICGGIVGLFYCIMKYGQCD